MVVGWFGRDRVPRPGIHRRAEDLADSPEPESLHVGDYLEFRYNRSVRGLVALLLWIGSLSILAVS